MLVPVSRLVYDGRHRLVTDDRTLRHLQWVIGDKLRRHEPFMFTWTQPPEEGGGRLAVWVTPDVGLAYAFDERRSGPLNARWIQALALAAHTPAGLWLVPEPVDEDGETETSGPTHQEVPQ